MSRGADDELSKAFFHSCLTMKGETNGIREGRLMAFQEP